MRWAWLAVAGIVASLAIAGGWAWRAHDVPILSTEMTVAVATGAPASAGGTGGPSPGAGRKRAGKTEPNSARRPAAGPIDPRFPGLRTFRGNASRDYYGEGPLPTHPVVRWRYPRSGGMCARSNDGTKTTTWCGTGWTGQPNVIPRPGGGVEIREGAYDDDYHFLDGHTGAPLRPDLQTGDLAKGSATTDSNGYPLYYAGSRDNLLRVVAIDRSTPTVLWSFDSQTQPGAVWNDDWDGAPLQIGDYLLEGGENSWFYVIRLNRSYDSAGNVEVAPRIVMRVPGWDQGLRDAVGDDDLSIENSVAFRRGVVYFSNSGGLVQGWDISDVLRGGDRYRRVFRFWSGDDNDATIVIEPHGDLIVGRKMEENVARPESFPRDHEVGDLIKLDPRKPNDPVVWSVQLGGFEPDDGVLGTPAYYRGVVYASYTDGGVAAVDATTGKVLWYEQLTPPTWSSPVPIADGLLIADGAGNINCFDISDPNRRPPLRWRVHLSDSVIESTPAVWHDWIYVGSRDGGIYGVSDPRAG